MKSNYEFCMYQDNQHKYSKFEKKYICSDLGGGGVIIYNITSMILEESVFQFFPTHR